MRLYEIVLVGLMSAIDGFFLGLAYGIKGVRFKSWQLIGLAVWTVPLVLAAMLAAALVGEFVPATAAQRLGGILLIAAGALSLIESLRKSDENKALTPVQVVLAGIGLALDGSVAAFSLGLLGAGMLVTAGLIAFMQTVLLFTGNKLGVLSKLAGGKIQLLPAFILMIMGFFKLLPA